MSAIWLEAEDLLGLIGQRVSPDTRVRDGGVLYAAAARPRATLVGSQVYPSSLEQAAALLHAIIRWRPLQVWNAHLGWAAAEIHLEARGFGLSMPVSERRRLTDELMNATVDSVPALVERLEPYCG